jgi:hypothetical protein
MTSAVAATVDVSSTQEYLENFPLSGWMGEMSLIRSANLMAQNYSSISWQELTMNVNLE